MRPNQSPDGRRPRHLASGPTRSDCAAVEPHEPAASPGNGDHGARAAFRDDGTMARFSHEAPGLLVLRGDRAGGITAFNMASGTAASQSTNATAACDMTTGVTVGDGIVEAEPHQAADKAGARGWVFRRPLVDPYDISTCPTG